MVRQTGGERRAVFEALECRRMLSASAAHAGSGRVLHAVVGRNLDTTIGTLSVAPPQNATVDVNWGDGSGLAPATLFQTGRRIEVISSHTYTNPATSHLDALSNT